MIALELACSTDSTHESSLNKLRAPSDLEVLNTKHTFGTADSGIRVV